MGKFFSDKTEEGIRLVWMQPDPVKAESGQALLQQAVDDGEADAYNFLARSYMGVNALDEDRDKAFELLEKGANMGSACCLITMLQFNALTKTALKIADSAKFGQAVAEIQAKADGGHAFCQLMIGMYYFWGGYIKVSGSELNGDDDKELSERIEKATPWFEKALYGGMTAALYNLYDIYEDFHEGTEELEKALRFAAGQGDRYWRVRFANWLFENEKYEEALEAFKKLAEDGYIRAWYDVGIQYERGIGTEQNGAIAMECYEEGAKLGNGVCQIRLGKQLMWGRLAPKDEAQAYFWFCEAGKQQGPIAPVAKMWQGHCLFYGMGTKKDVDEGTNLLMDALNYNYPDSGESQSMADESQFDWIEDMLQMFWDLGVAYENGWGMPQRDSLAGYYFHMVAENGWPEAIEKMTHYKKGLLGKWKRIK